MGKPKRRSQMMCIDGEEGNATKSRKRTNNAAQITATLREVMVRSAAEMVIDQDKDDAVRSNTDWQNTKCALPTSTKAISMKIDSNPPTSAKKPSQVLSYNGPGGPRPTLVKLTTNQGAGGVVKKRSTRALTTKTQKRRQKGLERAMVNLDKVAVRVTKQRDRGAWRNALKKAWE